MAMEGYRESVESWKEIRRGVKEHAEMAAPLVVVGDGIAGLWKALADIYPTAKDQRCWKHKMVNILDKVPSLKQRRSAGPAASGVSDRYPRQSRTTLSGLPWKI